MKQLTLFLLVSLLILVSTTTTFAFEANTLSVSPSIVRLDLKTDQPETTVTYKNNSTQILELTLSASDVTELEDGYKLAFLDPKTAADYKYALSDWISFDQTDIILKPQTSQTVKVFINQAKLSPGGHYGSIIAKAINQPTDKTVSVQGVLSSLIFVRNNTGQEKESGKVEQFAATQKLLAFPETFFLRFHNLGNTEVVPYGLITITDAWGHEVAKGIVNEGSLIALPESVKRYDVKITKETAFLFPGIYKVSLNGHFGETNQKYVATTTFFSEGSLPLIPLTLVAIILLIFLLKRHLKLKR